MGIEIRVDWSEQYLLGDSLIDNQHQRIFALANEVFAATEPQIPRLVMELFRYTREHFSAEEQLMHARKDPGLTHHIIEHEKLIEMLSQLVEARGFDSEIFLGKLKSLMVDWILIHILEEDAKIPRE